MFDFVKNLFNGKSTPEKITTLPQVMRGHELEEIGGYVRWHSLEYNVRLYAVRNKDKSYAVKCSYDANNMDCKEITLRSRVSLAEAMAELRKYDNKETDRRMHTDKYLEYSVRQQQIEKARDDNNVRLVQNRLTASNPMRH